MDGGMVVPPPPVRDSPWGGAGSIESPFLCETGMYISVNARWSVGFTLVILLIHQSVCSAGRPTRESIRLVH